MCGLISSCGSGETDSPPPATLPPSVFMLLHQLSERIYDGQGTWGESFYGYTMPLRDAYWRADVYDRLHQQGHPQGEEFRARVVEVTNHLLRVQRLGGTGVFGFPADPDNPEFGARVTRVMAECPECIRNGWITSLPDEKIAELYYDHGYALTTLAKIQAHSPNPERLAAIIEAANWTLNKPLSNNINYLSALSKGLSYAYMITGEHTYLDKAIELHQLGIFPFLSNGQAIDEHNAQLEYHGFIVSGLLALRRVMPESHALSTTLDQHLTDALTVMRERGLIEQGNYGATWLGTNLLAWDELAKWRKLTPEEQKTLDRIMQLVTNHTAAIEEETEPYRQQKALYSYFSIGLFSE